MRAAAMLLIALVGAVAASGCEDKRPNKCKPKALTRCEKSKNLRKKCALSCGVCSVGAAAAAAACADKASEKTCQRFAMKNKCSKSKAQKKCQKTCGVCSIHVLGAPKTMACDCSAGCAAATRPPAAPLPRHIGRARPARPPRGRRPRRLPGRTRAVRARSTHRQP